MAQRMRLADYPQCRVCRRGPRGACPCVVKGSSALDACSECGVHRAGRSGKCAACVDLAGQAAIARNRRRLRFGNR